MITLPKYVSLFMKTFQEKNYQIYVVGGALRELLLGHNVDNWDFATSATPEEILKLYPDGFYNNQFGTVGIPRHSREGGNLDPRFHGDDMVFEVTTFRKEGNYEDGRHPSKIEWAKTVEEDLARRDFTINALAYDGKKLIDLYDGQKHLKERLIVAVGDPDKRFSEDALRLMRAIRFASELGFLIEEKTRESILKNSELITKISWERIRDELLRIIASDNPSEGILFLRSTGILSHILPEVDDCFGIEQVTINRHHIYDVGTHLIMALKHCPSYDVITRLAALLHDTGKKRTFRKDETTGQITFHNHEVIGGQIAEKVAERLRLSKKQKEKLVLLVRMHMFTVSELQTDKAVRRFIREVGKENLRDMLDIRTSDRVGSGSTPTSWRLELFKKRLEEVQKEPFTVKDLKITGNDVMKSLKLEPGPKIGEILNKLFDEVVEGKLKNEKAVLLKEVRDYK